MADFNQELSQFSRFAVWTACLAAALPALAQPNRVLVVHNAAFPESLEVADYYMTRRGIPAANLCAINVSTDAQINPGGGTYAALVQAPIRQCLNTVGPSNILYIVMSYRTPIVFAQDTSYFYYAVDSFVADVWDRHSSAYPNPYPAGAHSYFADNQNAGNYYAPYLPLATYRANPKSIPIYAVWRLDAPSVALAKALVDKAIAAEQAGGPGGQGCFDARFSAPTRQDLSYDMGEWEVYRAARGAQLAGLPFTENVVNAEISCPNTSFFVGWYSLNSYNTNFSWVDGSYAVHMDSLSLTNPRYGSSWGVGALNDGVTAISGAVDEPYLQGFPRMAGVLRNLFEGATLGEAVLRNTRWLRWRMMNVGDPLYRPYPSGHAPFNAPTPENSLRISSRHVIGGRNASATIYLNAPAPAGGTVFALSKTGPINNPPATVTVPQGSKSVTFSITSPIATVEAYFSITAVAGSVTVRNDGVVYPLLGALETVPGTVQGGNSVQGTVYLYDRAPLGGATVALQSNNPAVQVPATVLVPQGKTQVNFTATTSAVGANTTVTISATHAGSQKTFNLTVTP